LPRLRKAREGEPLRVRGLVVPYSFWPAMRTRRWRLQRRLYVRDPWAILNEAVYRAKGCKGKHRDEALAYIEQAEEYFSAGIEGKRPAVKPVLLYYSMLNLAKCLIKVRRPELDLSTARHGLAVKHRAGWGVLGDRVSVRSSAAYINIFPELMRQLEGATPTFGQIAVRELLPQILPGHRLWTYASRKNEKFLAVGIECLVRPTKQRAWVRLNFDRGEVHSVVTSVEELIRKARLPGKWRQVHAQNSVHAKNGGLQDAIVLEPIKTAKYHHRPIDCVQHLFQQLRSALWYTITSSKPHRAYYVFLDSHLGQKRLPQWAAMYILFYYLSDLTRYRPHLFDRLVAIKYGPQVENVLDECPRQFLYLMASELLERDVAPAGIAV
jgi:YaaC-like Protein